MHKKPFTTLKISSGHKVKIDREDLVRVKAHVWKAYESSTGRLKVIATLRGQNKVRTITLGKFLMNPPKGKQVYPRRFNAGLDYRKSNLIVCSLKERQQQLPKRRASTSSQYRGVSYSKANKNWRALIKVAGKLVSLGSFQKEEDAAKAYNVGARKHFGKSAYQNRVGGKSNRRKI